MDEYLIQLVKFALTETTQTFAPIIGAQVFLDMTGSTKELYKTLVTVRHMLVTGQELSTESVNACLLGASFYTGASALAGYQQTTNPYAKAMYGLSTSFSTSAITTSGVAIAARTCRISRPAFYSEMFAWICLQLGNKAHVSALLLENKPVPAHLQSRLYLSKEIRQVLANNHKNYGKNLAFVMAGGASDINSIPIKTIGKYVGISFSVYAYTKLLIGSYRYGRRFCEARKKSRLYRKYNEFFVVRLTLLANASHYGYYYFPLFYEYNKVLLSFENHNFNKMKFNL